MTRRDASDPAATASDERLAELRDRRRARARYLAVRAAVAAGALTLAVVVFAYWLLTSVGGRDLLLRQIVARLPDNATLTWQHVDGPAYGPLTLRGVRFSFISVCAPADAACKKPSGPMVFNADRVHVDFALRPLLGKRLRLDALQIGHATLALPRDDEPFELPRWPESLPKINPPLWLQADDIRIDELRVTRDNAPLIDIHKVRGGMDAQQGKLHVERLAIDSDRGRFTMHGDYIPREHYRTDLTATAVMPVSAGRTPARLGFVAKGDLSRMDVALSGAAPGPVRATLTMRGEEHPRWRLHARADALDIGLLTTPGAAPAATPMALTFDADGVDGNANLRGRFDQGDFNVVVLPSKIQVSDQVLQVQPLSLQLFDGVATLRGRADFTVPEDAKFRFAVNARDLRWGGKATSAAGKAAPPPAIGANADLGFAGTLKAWAAIGRATLTRDGQRATVQFDGRGNDQHMALKTLKATMPTGTLDAHGDVAWKPQLQWRLDATLAGFDPGYFAPGWNGAVNGNLATTGSARSSTAPRQSGGGFDADLALTDLGGRLRGRPLGGRGSLAIRGDVYRGDVALSLGNSRVDAKGTVADSIDIDASFAPLHLEDLLPDAAGTLRGTLKLTGARTAPNVDADLSGSGLRVGGYRATTLTAKGRLPWRNGNGALAIRASGLEAGIPFDTLTLDARGAVEALQLDASARGEIGALSLSGHAGKRGPVWQGALASLQLAPSRGAQWRLQQAAQFRWDGRNGMLSNACLSSSGGGALCASADWPRRGLDIDGTGLPLTLLLPYLPEREDKRPWLLRGEMAIDAQVRPVGNSWRGQATITSASGGLRNTERSRREVIRYDALTLRTTFDPQRLQAELGAALNGDGRIDGGIL